jgi:hypothetical protein
MIKTQNSVHRFENPKRVSKKPFIVKTTDPVVFMLQLANYHKTTIEKALWKAIHLILLLTTISV